MIPFSKNIIADFHHQNQLTYGYSNETADIEIVNVRVRAIGEVTRPPLQKQNMDDKDASTALLERRAVLFDDKEHSTPFYRAESLRAGNVIQGPAIVVRADTTILIGVHDRAVVDAYGNLLIKINSVIAKEPF